MITAQPARRAVVLSSSDVPGAGQLLVHACEDCACPVSEGGRASAVPALPPVSATKTVNWIRGREIIEIDLDPEYRLLFNPVGRGGAVVVNHAAQQILRCLDHPATWKEVRAAASVSSNDADQVLNRLHQLEVIHPVDHVQRPVFYDSQLLTAWLHITNACNLRCPYCYLHKTAENMDEQTGRAAVEAVIASAVRNGFPAVKLKYAGGEASLNHRLMMSLHAHARALADAKELTLHATLLSNGVALPRHLIRSLKTEDIKVMISLNGVGGSHDVQRPSVNGRPSFHLVDRTIAALIEENWTPHLSITITRRNAEGVPEVVRFALERGLTFSLNFFRDNDCATNFPDLRYEEETMTSAVLAAFKVIEEFLPPWSVLGSVLDRGQLLEPRRRSCGVGQDYVVIDQRGRVAKCHMEIERTLGDVFRDDPLQLIQRDTAAVQNLPVEEKEGCRDCSWRYWCSGGCSIATFRATGRYDIKSPNCNIYKSIYPEALRLEGMRLLKYALPAMTGKSRLSAATWRCCTPWTSRAWLSSLPSTLIIAGSAKPHPPMRSFGPVSTPCWTAGPVPYDNDLYLAYFGSDHQNLRLLFGQDRTSARPPRFPPHKHGDTETA